MKTLITLIFCYLLSVFTLSAQSEATLKGSSLIAGTVDLSSIGLANVTGGSRTFFFNLQPSYQRFIVDRIAVGGIATITGNSGGTFSQTRIGVGPKATYFIDSGNDWIPYVDGSLLYGRSQNDGLAGVNEVGNFLQAGVSVGMALRKDHLGILFDLGYEYTNDDTIGNPINQIFVSVGLVGFLYQEIEE
ncbi:MAG: hypothetical protein AAGI23_09790 [Bacteroidota bacterium]